MENIKTTELSEQQARIWLIENDTEAADFWKKQPEGGLATAVCDNLKQYGCQEQQGQYQVYFDDETLERIDWYDECKREGFNVAYWRAIN